MRWLTSLMEEGPVRVKSLGGLARLALAHPGWPEGPRPQERSLAALLSKMDRGLELDWLADRPEVQGILADVLGASPARITEALGEGLGRQQTRRARIRLTDVPVAAPLDLRAEPPPPGIPADVLEPRTWERTWWVAPEGSGRSLAGAYLEARGLAAWISARTFEEAREMLPAKGPVYVELWGGGAEVVDVDRPGTCIATARSPDGPEWTILHSPEPASFVPALVRWLAARLPGDGRFDPEGARPLLERECATGLVDGLGSALGLAGLVDRFGAEEIATRGVASAVERLLAEKLSRAARESGIDPTWLEKHAMDILVRLAHGALVTDVPWDAPRPFDAYMNLVPGEWKDRVDVEWLRSSLARSAAPRTVKDVERALRETSPGAFRVVRALERAGILRAEGSGDALVVAPRIAARLAQERAKKTVITGTSEGWGEILLSADPAFLVKGALARVLAGDDEWLTEPLEAPDPESPEAVVTLELAFRVAGLARLAGADVGNDVLSALWDRQSRLVLPRDDGPHPRIGYPEVSMRKEPLLRVGTFRLAALAAAEANASAGGAPAVSVLPPRAEALRLYDSIVAALRDVNVTETPWALAAFELAGRVRSEESVSRPLHPLEWPDVVLTRFERNELEWRDLEAPVTALGMTALLALAKARGVSVRRLVEAAFLCFEGAPAALAAGSFLSPEWQTAAEVFAVAPPSAVAVSVATGKLDPARLPWSVLSAEHFRELVAMAPGRVLRIEAALRAMPAVVLRSALGETSLPANAVTVLHERDRDAVLDALVDALGAGNEKRALFFLENVPTYDTARVVRKLEELRLLARETLPFRLVRAFLHDRVSERSPGFRDAYALLARLEAGD